jgi:HAD superfamily hydrolase (TIGR01484 family)
MIPLRDAGDALRGVRALAFDVDDTVTRGGHLEAIALDAMHRARDAGLVLVAATGRPIGWAEVFVATWPLAAAVGENGAGICLPFTEASLVIPEALARERRAHAKALVASNFPALAVSADDTLRRVDVAFDIGERATVAEDVIENVRALLESNGYATTRSSVHVHALPASYDKASGLEGALAALGISPDDVAFVGDSPNDAAAFARFARSVGVANVRDHEARLDTKPRFVTEGDRGAGFAELVGALIEARS